MPNSARSSRALPFVFLGILWLGALLGVSFLATPIKFRAPSLDLRTALDVGRATFAAFSKTEWALCLLLIGAAFLWRKLRVWNSIGIAGLALVLIVQAVWLLPILDERVGQILAGSTVPPTNHHVLYIVADTAKALLLAAISLSALWDVASASGAD
jgi:hypothetical protein